MCEATMLRSSGPGLTQRGLRLRYCTPVHTRCQPLCGLRQGVPFHVAPAGRASHSASDGTCKSLWQKGLPSSYSPPLGPPRLGSLAVHGAHPHESSDTRGSWRGSHPIRGRGTRSLNPIDGRERHVETMGVPESRRAVTQIGCSSTSQPARPRTSMREHRLCPRGDRCTNP